jgi:hypothetical protein
MQQRIPVLAVVQFRRRGLKAMCNATLSVDADVRFHIEEPIASLLNRLHFGISRLGLVIGR